jgi:predicted TPR repeat methyltransferase
MANEWDEYAADWESDATTSQFSDLVLNELLKITSLEQKLVLDLGCGTGLLSQRMSSTAKSIVAIDPSEAMIEELDKKLLNNVEPVVDELTRGLVAQHPAFRRQFDCVVASSVCGFLKDFTETASIIHNILDEQGLFIHWDWLVEDDNSDYGLTIEKATKALRDAGFASISYSVPFELTTAEGKSASVLMGIGQK